MSVVSRQITRTRRSLQMQYVWWIVTQAGSDARSRVPSHARAGEGQDGACSFAPAQLYICVIKPRPTLTLPRSCRGGNPGGVRESVTPAFGQPLLR
jgi:hypothetical protein